MGINVILEYEDGERISEVHDWQGTISLLAHAAHANPSYRLLRYLDPWSHTLFNTRQIPDLIEDLELARRQSASDHV